MHLQALTLAAVLCLSFPTDGFSLSYERRLGSDWKRAAESLVAERERWGEVFASLDVDAAECEAIIFPERLRYSRLKDGLERAALNVLYVQDGSLAADFSIGVFQMKPSFAEEVEKAWMHSPMREVYKLYFDVKDFKEARQQRVKRLSEERWQCVYLGVFVKLMIDREPSLETLSPLERVRLLATAYNYSFSATLEELRKTQSRETFHLDSLPSKKTARYSYAGIAAEWYSHVKHY